MKLCVSNSLNCRIPLGFELYIVSTTYICEVFHEYILHLSKRLPKLSLSPYDFRWQSNNSTLSRFYLNGLLLVIHKRVAFCGWVAASLSCNSEAKGISSVDS